MIKIVAAFWLKGSFLSPPNKGTNYYTYHFMKNAYFPMKQWRLVAVMAFVCCFFSSVAFAGANLYYIPPASSNLPAVFTDIDPGAPYVLADQACAQTVVTNDSFCLDFIWDDNCQDAYNLCLYGCTNPQWYLLFPFKNWTS